MLRRGLHIFLAVGVAWIVNSHSSILADSVVIRDQRVMDLGVTPVLGRGYSISTNTYQSICLSGIKLTEPSYDFTYQFSSIENETDLLVKLSIAGAAEGFRNEMAKKLSGNGKTTVINNTRYFNHHVLAEINLHSYYASIDESAAQLSSPAKTLLTNKDLPGFFASCGAYYIRSIGRKAKFIAVFSYSSLTNERDLQFEADIETQINGFGKDKSQENARQISMQSEYQFRLKSEQRRLKINVSAFGLGKNQDASLISYDIDSFKEALKEAFISMQNPQTGKVSSIEVVPWVENTDFQSVIRLEQRTAQPADQVASGREKNLILYEKKQILNMNAEFLAEISRIDRSMLNLYYKARLCRQHINENYRASGGSGALKPEYKQKKVIHLRGGQEIPLTRLDSYLHPEFVESLLIREERFLYGGKDLFSASDFKSGAQMCMRQLLRRGLHLFPYRELEACSQTWKSLVTVDDEMINNYCMPMLKD